MYVISYDISNDRIRKKISDTLENYGKRVQFSVFECNISEKQLIKLYSQIAELAIKDDEASIRIYSLCKNCQEKIQTIGLKNEAMTQEEEDLFII